MRLLLLITFSVAFASAQTNPVVPKKDTLTAQTTPDSPEKPDKRPAVVSTITTDELRDFGDYPTELQSLIVRALELTKENLTYQFGSSDPANGGMDCSGTIFHLLRAHCIKDVPRSSDEMCRWLQEKKQLHLAENARSLDDKRLASLRPGDLLFWTGTYEHEKRSLPISHVMLYLGKRAKNGKAVVFGASDGRTFNGERQCGVSVFDFHLPKEGAKAAFHSYGPIPGLLKEVVRKAEAKSEIDQSP